LDRSAGKVKRGLPKNAVRISDRVGQNGERNSYSVPDAHNPPARAAVWASYQADEIRPVGNPLRQTEGPTKQEKGCLRWMLPPLVGETKARPVDEKNKGVTEMVTPEGGW